LNYPPPERTVGEARERHPTARFELLRQSRPDRRGGSCGGPNGHFRPLREDRATHGHLWPPLYSQVAHCYALVKTSAAGDRPRPASGLPWPFKPELNQLKTAVHIGAPHNRPHRAHNPAHNLGRKPRPGSFRAGENRLRR